jgi:hypothetical protein
MEIIPHCPILRPTEKQFQNFELYVSQLSKIYANKVGIVKVLFLNRSFLLKAGKLDKNLMKEMKSTNFRYQVTLNKKLLELKVNLFYKRYICFTNEFEKCYKFRKL